MTISCLMSNTCNTTNAQLVAATGSLGGRNVSHTGDSSMCERNGTIYDQPKTLPYVMGERVISPIIARVYTAFDRFLERLPFPSLPVAHAQETNPLINRQIIVISRGPEDFYATKVSGNSVELKSDFFMDFLEEGIQKVMFIISVPRESDSFLSIEKHAAELDSQTPPLTFESKREAMLDFFKAIPEKPINFQPFGDALTDLNLKNDL